MVEGSFGSGLARSVIENLKTTSPRVVGRLVLGRPYGYSRRRPLTVREEARSDARHSLVRLSFQRDGEERFAGLLMRPRAKEPCPCALLLHPLSSDKETMISHFGHVLADRGFASLALDANLHGERRRPRAEPLGPIEYLDLLRESVIEYRQAMDHLATRGELDTSRLGLLGYSLGAMMGAVLAGVDSRVRASVFMVGGDLVREHVRRVPPVLQGVLNSVSPAHFVARVSPRPVLFINGTQDTVVPRRAAEIFHRAAREPKEVFWADAGHILPPEAALRGVDWLQTRLA